MPHFCHKQQKRGVFLYSTYTDCKFPLGSAKIFLPCRNTALFAPVFCIYYSKKYAKINLKQTLSAYYFNVLLLYKYFR